MIRIGVRGCLFFWYWLTRVSQTVVRKMVVIGVVEMCVYLYVQLRGCKTNKIWLINTDLLQTLVKLRSALLWAICLYTAQLWLILMRDQTVLHATCVCIPQVGWVILAFTPPLQSIVTFWVIFISSPARVGGIQRWLHTEVVCLPEDGNSPPRPTQLSSLSGMGNKYRHECTAVGLTIGNRWVLY